jgi:hypothetical protein
MTVDAEVADLLKAKELRDERLEVLGGQEIAMSGVAGCLGMECCQQRIHTHNI